MAHALTIRGVTASLVWGYHPAAVLGVWTVRKDEDGWGLEAHVQSTDKFRVTQQPLTFVATHATGAWRWPVITLAMTAGAVTARLGPKEASHAIEVRPAGDRDSPAQSR